MYGAAVLDACEQIIARIEPVASKHNFNTFAEVYSLSLAFSLNSDQFEPCYDENSLFHVTVYVAGKCLLLSTDRPISSRIPHRSGNWI